MTHTTALNVISDHIVFINLTITCWSGKRVLTPEDLGLDRKTLPPETLISMGDKQLINPAALRDFTSIRSAAQRQCLAVGTRFMGGYIVPVTKAQSLLARLDELAQQFHTKRDDFLARFDHLVSDWADQQPSEWQKLIHQSLIPAQYVGQKLGYSVQAMTLGNPAPEVTTHTGLDEAIGGLSGQIYKEVGQMAKECLNKSFSGSHTVTRKVLGSFRAIRDKLDGLSFIDSRMAVIVDEIDRLINSVVPSKGAIDSAIPHLAKFLNVASDPNALREYAAQKTVLDCASHAAAWVSQPDPVVVNKVEAEVETETEMVSEADWFSF